MHSTCFVYNNQFVSVPQHSPSTVELMCRLCFLILSTRESALCGLQNKLRALKTELIFSLRPLWHLRAICDPVTHHHGRLPGAWNRGGHVLTNPSFGTCGWLFYNYMIGGLRCGMPECSPCSGQKTEGLTSVSWSWSSRVLWSDLHPEPFLFQLWTWIVNMGLVHSLGWRPFGHRKPESLSTACGSNLLFQPAGKPWFSPRPTFHLSCSFPRVPTGCVSVCD